MEVEIKVDIPHGHFCEDCDFRNVEISPFCELFQKALRLQGIFSSQPRLVKLEKCQQALSAQLAKNKTSGEIP